MVIYDSYNIVFQEIPNEVSLAFTLKGCLNRCEGCHSPQLRENFGDEITDEILFSLIDKYKGEITNVLFLGEGSDKIRLLELMDICSSNGLKVSLYSGLDYIDPDYLTHINYYKVGSYKHEFGGLDKKTTNQQLFKMDISDITYKLFK